VAIQTNVTGACHIPDPHAIPIPNPNPYRTLALWLPSQRVAIKTKPHKNYAKNKKYILFYLEVDFSIFDSCIYSIY